MKVYKVGKISYIDKRVEQEELRKRPQLVNKGKIEQHYKELDDNSEMFNAD
jgi:hypothetical protein